MTEKFNDKSDVDFVVDPPDQLGILTLVSGRKEELPVFNVSDGLPAAFVPFAWFDELEPGGSGQKIPDSKNPLDIGIRVLRAEC